ncbi:MAG: lactoylglutathione lyase and related lyase [Gammaproteobacteria bacterium]|jgi:catechol 2,3-dioxygenase-like lactoylglutathione lyase family enzyme|nr:lactoylglutathione lyase and related lyase [Gammaproteobacteria bacterium]
MLDHIGIKVSDYKKAKTFYQSVLAPLGYELLVEVHGFAGFGLKNQPQGPIASFWIHQSEEPTSLHLAFTASSREAVEQFYQAALAAGGKDNGKPGVREMYHPNYYGAFVIDFDGRNIEAVCHK